MFLVKTTICFFNNLFSSFICVISFGSHVLVTRLCLIMTSAKIYIHGLFDPIAIKDTTNICGSFLLSGIFLLYLGDVIIWIRVLKTSLFWVKTSTNLSADSHSLWVTCLSLLLKIPVKFAVLSSSDILHLNLGDVIIWNLCTRN